MRRDWIEERLEELRPRGKTKAGLADAMGLPATRISAIIKGERKLDAPQILGLAQYLEISETEALVRLSGGPIRPAELSSVLVIGAVQAGAWREAIEWDEEERFQILSRPMARYAHVPQFGLEVIGPSMNIPYPEGSVVICVSLIHLGRDPQPGEHVVCSRTSDQGIEATIKELRKDEAGAYWLWPMSTHPSFQQPWKLPTVDEHADSDHIRITALVIGAVKPSPNIL